MEFHFDLASATILFCREFQAAPSVFLEFASAHQSIVPLDCARTNIAVLIAAPNVQT
jgi:hypothetical protein